jgi:hypothetical protein
VVAQLRRHFLNILTPVLELKRLFLTEGGSVRGQELTGVRALCRLLALRPAPAPPAPDEEDNEGFSKMRFLFASVPLLLHTWAPNHQWPCRPFWL